MACHSAFCKHCGEKEFISSEILITVFQFIVIHFDDQKISTRHGLIKICFPDKQEKLSHGSLKASHHFAV